MTLTPRRSLQLMDRCISGIIGIPTARCLLAVCAVFFAGHLPGSSQTSEAAARLQPKGLAVPSAIDAKKRGPAGDGKAPSGAPKTGIKVPPTVQTSSAAQISTTQPSADKEIYAQLVRPNPLSREILEIAGATLKVIPEVSSTGAPVARVRIRSTLSHKDLRPVFPGHKTFSKGTGIFDSQIDLTQPKTSLKLYIVNAKGTVHQETIEIVLNQEEWKQLQRQSLQLARSRAPPSGSRGVALFYLPSIQGIYQEVAPTGVAPSTLQISTLTLLRLGAAVWLPVGSRFTLRLDLEGGTFRVQTGSTTLYPMAFGSMVSFGLVLPLGAHRLDIALAAGVRGTPYLSLQSLTTTTLNAGTLVQAAAGGDIQIQFKLGARFRLSSRGSIAARTPVASLSTSDRFTLSPGIALTGTAQLGFRVLPNGPLYLQAGAFGDWSSLSLTQSEPYTGTQKLRNFGVGGIFGIQFEW